MYGVHLYELLIFIVLSVILECGIGIVYGVGIGYDPMIVFPAAIILNFVGVIVAVLVMDWLLNWRKGLRSWLEKKLTRVQRLIDKYGSFGIVFGVFFLSPIQLAIVGKLLCMKPGKLYPALFGAICIVATAFLAIALGVFKILLA